MHQTTVRVAEGALDANQTIAESNRADFDAAGVTVVNLMSAPGAGKTKCIERLSFLAGRERRHLVVLDAKGGHDGLAQGVVAAYLAAWPDARVRLFPQEPLDIWRGTPAAVVNRDRKSVV